MCSSDLSVNIKGNGNMKINQNSVKLKAKAGNTPENFDIYVKYGSRWDYLMSHRSNAGLYTLLSRETSLRQLREDSQKAVAGIALRGKRHYRRGRNVCIKQCRTQSQRMEDSVNHLISVVHSYIEYECEDIAS